MCKALSGEGGIDTQRAVHERVGQQLTFFAKSTPTRVISLMGLLLTKVSD
jgi:hypothetical protein